MFFIEMIGHATRQMDALRLANFPVAGSDYWHEHGFAVVVCAADWTRRFFGELFKGSRPWSNTALHRTGLGLLVNCHVHFSGR
jgi:hypothetical protein